MKIFLTLVGNVNTLNLKNHQVLKLKCPSIKDWRSIYSRVWKKGPPGLIVLTMLLQNNFFSSTMHAHGLKPSL